MQQLHYDNIFKIDIIHNTQYQDLIEIDYIAK